MWGLVHPSLLNGEGGYYLTTLTSAVEVVKQLRFDNLPMESVDHPFTVCATNVFICIDSKFSKIKSY